MAFNPFNWFRKHQKKLIAVVTIFIMFIFVLQFGRGDAFERLATFFGAKGQKGEVVAEINGTKIRESEIQKTSRARRAASDFLLNQAYGRDGHHAKALQQIMQKELRIDLGTTSPINDPVRELRMVCQRIQSRNLQNLALIQQFQPGQFLMRLFSMVEQLPADLETLENLAGDERFVKPSVATERLELLRKVATLIGYQQWQLTQWAIQAQEQREGITSFVPDDLVFGGNSRTQEDTLDFIMWKHHADKLKVQLTDADLARAINQEAAGEVFADPDKVDLEKDGQIQTFLRRGEHSGMPVKDFIEALRDEFRVVMVQGILLGAEPGVRAYRSLISASASPASVTPDEFLNFYRRSRTTLKVQMLPIPVEKYLPLVKESPTQDEIESRYRRFKDREWMPNSRDPGFKESRRIVVQYLIADSDHPQHRGDVKKLMAFFQATNQPLVQAERSFAAAATAPSHLGNPLGPLACLVGTIGVDPLATDYEKYASEQSPWLLPVERDEEMRFLSQTRIRQEDVHAPRAILSLIAAGWRGPLVGLGNHYMSATQIELRRSMRQVGGFHLLAMGTMQNAGELIGAAALAMAANPEVRSREEMYGPLLSQLEERLARELIRARFDAVTKELARLKADPAAADKYLEQVLKESPALKLMTMPEPRSMMVLAEELDLDTNATLKAVLEPMRKRVPLPNERDFVPFLFFGVGPYDAHRVPPHSDDPRQYMNPDFEPAFEQIEILWWRREDNPARVRPLSEVRDKIILAWKMDRARTLARKDADDLAAKINKNIRDKKWTAADAERELREHAAKFGETFELDNVARYVLPQRETHMMQQGEYRPYVIPPEVRAKFPYSTRDLVEQLLTLEKPGRSTVVADGPHRNYYVAVLVARDVPTVRQFRDSYARAPRIDPLYALFVRERNEEYRRSVMRYLREEAGKVNKDGRFEIPEDLRRRESRSDED